MPSERPLLVGMDKASLDSPGEVSVLYPTCNLDALSAGTGCPSSGDLGGLLGPGTQAPE